MTPEDAAEERVEEDVEEEEAVFLLDELDGARSAASKEADSLSRVDLRDCAGMLLQTCKYGGGEMMKDEGVSRSICGVFGRLKGLFFQTEPAVMPYVECLKGRIGRIERQRDEK